MCGKNIEFCYDYNLLFLSLSILVNRVESCHCSHKWGYGAVLLLREGKTGCDKDSLSQEYKMHIFRLIKWHQG